MYHHMREAYGLFSEVIDYPDIHLSEVNEVAQMDDRFLRRVVCHRICRITLISFHAEVRKKTVL